jgi:hypothetical protein
MENSVATSLACVKIGRRCGEDDACCIFGISLLSDCFIWDTCHGVLAFLGFCDGPGPQASINGVAKRVFGTDTD